jgi:acyl-CoA thioesterase
MSKHVSSPGASAPNFLQPLTPLGAGRFTYTAPPEACVGPDERQFFMGGAAMAVAIDALQQTADKPLLWATIQFLNQGVLGETFEIDVETLGGGRNVSHLQATLRRDDTVLQRTIAALGARTGEPDKQFFAMPDVPPPDDCPPKRDDAYGRPGNLIGQFDRRTALEDTDAGLEYLWIRPRNCTIDTPMMGVISDFFLGAHARARGGTSLDNTIRMVMPCPTPWVLSVTEVAGFGGGAMHGTQHHFAEDGTLIATSSQSGLLPRTPNP